MFVHERENIYLYYLPFYFIFPSIRHNFVYSFRTIIRPNKLVDPFSFGIVWSFEKCFVFIQLTDLWRKRILWKERMEMKMFLSICIPKLKGSIFLYQLMYIRGHLWTQIGHKKIKCRFNFSELMFIWFIEYEHLYGSFLIMEMYSGIEKFKSGIVQT